MDNFLSVMVSIIIFLKWFMHDALVHSLNNPLVQRYRICTILCIHWGVLIDHGSIKRICSFVVSFNRLPKHVTITSTGCLNDSASSAELSIEVPVSDKLSGLLVLAFSQAPSWSVSFPRVFFDRLRIQYEDNVKEFLAFFGSWLLGLNVSEDISTQDDRLSVIHGDSGNKKLKHGYSYIIVYSYMCIASYSIGYI